MRAHVQHFCQGLGTIWVIFFLGMEVKEEAFWGCFSQKMTSEPRSYNRTRCFSLYVESQTLGSGLWFNEIIIFKKIHCDHVKVIGPSETPDTTLKLLHAQ